MKYQFNPLSLYTIGLGLAVSQIIYFYPLLPERIASHFGPSGIADGWMSKDGFMVFYAVLLVFTAGVLGGIGPLITKLPSEMINVPNKEYWLAPERRVETLRAMQDQMGWFGAATMALLIAMMQLAFLANLMPEPRLDNRAGILLGAYLVYTVVWTIGLMRRFPGKG